MNKSYCTGCKQNKFIAYVGKVSLCNTCFSRHDERAKLLRKLYRT